MAGTEATVVDSQELEAILIPGLHNEGHARAIAEAIRAATAGTEATMVDSQELEAILIRGLHNEGHARAIAEAIRAATANPEKRSRRTREAGGDDTGHHQMGDSLFGFHIRKALRTMRGSA